MSTGFAEDFDRMVAKYDFRFPSLTSELKLARAGKLHVLYAELANFQGSEINGFPIEEVRAHFMEVYREFDRYCRACHVPQFCKPK